VVTIELGELAAAEVPAGPEMSHGTRRALLAALVAVACALGLVASARAEPSLGEPLWSGPVSLVGFNLGPDSLYLAEPNGRVVLARELRTGRERWRLEIDALPLMSTYAGEGVAAVQTRVPAPADQGTNTVLLVREATGQTIGRTSGDVVGPATTGHQLILVRPAELANDSCPTFGLPCVDVAAIDITTGREQPRLSLSGEQRLTVSTVDGRADSYGTYQADGTIRVYDAGSGALIDSMNVGAGLAGFVTLSPDLLMTTRRDGDAMRLDAYRRGPLTPLWSTALPVTGSEDGPAWWLAGDDCGAVVCARTGDRTVLLDRETGRPRFEYQGEIAGAVGSGALLGYELRREPSSRQVHDVEVLDPRTGAVRNVVRDAAWVGWPGSGGRVLVAQQGTGRTAFVLIQADGSTRVLGSVDGVGLNCQARDAVLACAAPSGLLRVWSLPPSLAGGNR
jgi:hypothetical protein